jgi:ubiquinone/menaquinone biosynthesis C-methylase UbiE
MNIKNQNSQIIDRDAIIRAINAKQGMKIAELGCGAIGNFVYPLAKIVGKSGRIYAIDILKPVLENIQKRNNAEFIENIEVIWSDLEFFGAAKIASGTIDRGLFINTLFQMKDRGEAMREAYRLIKKGGRLIVADWKSESTPFGPALDKRLERKELKKIAQKHGFTEIQEFEAGNFHYGLIFEK